jgi:hypothetical protein
MVPHPWSVTLSVCLPPAASVASARPAAVAEGTALEGDEQTVCNGGDGSDGVLLVDKARCGAGIEGYLSNVCALLRPKVSPLLLASLFLFIACVILSAAHCAAFAAPVPPAPLSPALTFLFCNSLNRAGLLALKDLQPYSARDQRPPGVIVHHPALCPRGHGGCTSRQWCPHPPIAETASELSSALGIAPASHATIGDAATPHCKLASRATCCRSEERHRTSRHL